MTSGAEVTIVPSCAFISPCRPRCGEAAPACASRATPASLGSVSAAARGPCDGPRPGTGSQVAANGRQQLRIRQCGRRPAARRAITPLWALQTSPPRVERRARPLPRSTHPLETVAPSRRRGHRRDLRVAKGRRHTLPQQLNLHRQLANVALGGIQLGGQRLTGLRSDRAHRPAPAPPSIELQTDFSRDRIKDHAPRTIMRSTAASGAADSWLETPNISARSEPGSTPGNHSLRAAQGILATI